MVLVLEQAAKVLHNCHLHHKKGMAWVLGPMEHHILHHRTEAALGLKGQRNHHHKQELASELLLVGHNLLLHLRSWALVQEAMEQRSPLHRRRREPGQPALGPKEHHKRRRRERGRKAELERHSLLHHRKWDWVQEQLDHTRHHHHQPKAWGRSLPATEKPLPECQKRHWEVLRSERRSLRTVQPLYRNRQPMVQQAKSHNLHHR